MFDKNFIVVELANILAGPTTTMAFAELGARVIKIENPHTNGDATRGWKLVNEDRQSDICAYFSCANWGKESIAIDFSSSAGRQVAHDLIAKADIVVASFKPGDEVKLQLDYETAKRLNPQIIYGQINAYGSSDPRPGFDAILQAEAGFTYLNGEPDGPPTKMPVALVDLLAAHQLKEGLLLALLKREKTGHGSFVSVSLLQAGVASLANQATNYLVGDKIPQRMGSEHPNIVPYGSILRCSDGVEVVIAAATERQYRELVSAIGLEHLATDPEFATGPQRVEHRDHLLSIIRERAAAMDSQTLAAKLEAVKVPFGFVNDMRSVFAQAGAKRLLVDGDIGDRSVTGVRSLVIEGDAYEPATLSAPPHFDEHREDILTELLKYDAERQTELGEAEAFGSLNAT